MTTPNIEELIAKLRTSMGDLDCPNTYEFAMHQAADALQSQAERIKELESEVEMWKATANAVVDFEKVQLRAELADIAATEPVGKVEISHDINDAFMRSLPIGTKLFTHPMPAQDVTELVEALEGLMHKDCGEPAFVKARTALSKYKGAK